MKAQLLTGVNETLLRFDVHQLIGYVESTRSDDGGYCFYRLNESNAADTLYAVYVLTALDRPVQGPELRQTSCNSAKVPSTRDGVATYHHAVHDERLEETI